MKSITMSITAAAVLLLSVTSAIAENSVGYNKIVVPANSDAKLSLAFSDAAVATYAVSTKNATGVTVSATLTAGAYANAYYVRFVSGNGEGLWSTITTNTTNGITFENEDVLPFVSVGDSFRVYKHQTLGSLFPAGMYGKSYTNGTQVFIYENDVDSMGINKASSKIALYSTSGGGRWVGSGISATTPIKPETQFIVRNGSAQPLTLIMIGKVPDYKISALVAANGDLVMGTGYPVPVVLNGSGLEGASRQVFFYNNSATGINKAASKIALYSTSGGGRWVGSGVTGNELIQPSEMITLRLPATETATKLTFKKPY